MNHPVQQSCSNCYCWVRKNDTSGYCCFSPPDRVGPAMASFPTTAPDSWCFQWHDMRGVQTPQWVMMNPEVEQEAKPKVGKNKSAIQPPVTT